MQRGLDSPEITKCRGSSVRIGMAHVSHSVLTTSPCPLPTALVPALGVLFQPTPQGTSSQPILSGSLRSLPLASNLSHFPILLDFKGRPVEILTVRVAVWKCPFYLSSCNLGELGEHPWLPDGHPSGNAVSLILLFPSTPLRSRLCALLLGYSVGVVGMKRDEKRVPGC